MRLPVLIFAAILPWASTGTWAQASQPSGERAAESRAASNAASRLVESAPGCPGVDAEIATKLSIARKTLADGKPHAAIAYLDSLRSPLHEAQLIRADALRRVGLEDDAMGIYTRLQSTCLRPFALHGMGLILAGKGDNDAALDLVRQASELMPLNTTMRNDLGYLYLMRGDFRRAQFAFRTAIELDPADKRPLYNLVLSLIRQGEFEQAQALARKSEISDAEFEAMFAQAARIETLSANQRSTP